MLLGVLPLGWGANDPKETFPNPHVTLVLRAHAREVKKLSSWGIQNLIDLFLTQSRSTTKLLSRPQVTMYNV